MLEPIWTEKPETASRLRGRIEAVLASAQVAGQIDPDKPNPARWKDWLDHMLPKPKKLGRAATTRRCPKRSARLHGQARRDRRRRRRGRCLHV